jgi:hypothetical protein
VSKNRLIEGLARDAFWKWAEQAKSEGKDLGEVLDRAGVLLTPQRKAAIEGNVYGELADMLDSSLPHQWGDKDNHISTPEDMRQALIRRLRLFQEAYNRKAYVK